MLHSWLLELDDPIKISPPTTMIVALIGQTKTVPKPLTMKTAAPDLPKIGLIALTVMTMVISSMHVGSFMGIQKVIHATNRRKFVVVHLQIMFRKAQPRMRCSLLCPAFLQKMLAIMNDKEATGEQPHVNAAATNKGISKLKFQ
ncbi:unnamed protein product [Prunus armeniaca]